ncbi:hypothetical protein ZHAS_00017082 [Anopheles sinensis]|uniref:Uncharacterized protein n=1 Tax=Anopheles sinensis TaxID=74873 RepID=A0A084WFS4_ANOSI|nr:hypothetical protein ZHAS_00017082 [Anopheles sinensis]
MQNIKGSNEGARKSEGWKSDSLATNGPNRHTGAKPVHEMHPPSRTHRVTPAL